MTCVRVGFAAIALGATAAVASAQAQAQVASPEPTMWNHNGSVMYLVTNGSSREFYYQKPRQGMLDAGARPGSLLFRGEISNGQYLGTAYIFNVHCGPIPFEVKGPILDDAGRIVLSGEAPRVGGNCRTYASYTSNLEFRRLNSNEVAQSQEPLDAAQPSAIGVSKSEVPSKSDAPTAQHSVKNETPVAVERSAGVADPKVAPGTPTAQASLTNEMPAARDLDKYKWVAAFIVMIAWLLVVAFGKTLIRRKG